MQIELFLKVIHNKIINRVVFEHIKKYELIPKYPNEIISNKKYKWNELIDSALVLAGNGYFDLLVEHHKLYPPPQQLSRHIEKVFHSIIRIGRLDILRYYIEELKVEVNTKRNQIGGSLLLIYATKYNRMEIVEYLLKMAEDSNNTIVWDFRIALAVSPLSGNIEMVKFMSRRHSKSVDWRNHYYDASVYDNAALLGRIDMLEWLIENRDKQELLYHKIYEYAIQGGHLELIKYLVDRKIEYIYHHITSSVYLGFNLIDAAVYYNQFEILKYLHYEHRDSLGKHAESTVLNWSVNSLEMLIWLHENRTESCNRFLIDSAASLGRLDIIEWLTANRTEGCTTQAMDSAASVAGSLEVVKWLHHNRTEGCTKECMNRSSNLEVTKWLHENRTEGCTTLAMDYAASRGDLDMLIWLQENRTEGCTSDAMDSAAKNGHFETVKWLHHNRTEGCTMNVIDSTISNNQFEITKWLVENRSEFTSNNTEFSNNLDLNIIVYISLKDQCKRNGDFFNWFISLYPTERLQTLQNNHQLISFYDEKMKTFIIKKSKKSKKNKNCKIN